MSGFEELRDVSFMVTNALRRSAESCLATASPRDIEDAINEKMRDMKLFSSKLKLLRAKPSSSQVQIDEQQLEKTLEEYGNTVMWKVLENLTVNSLTQAHAVKLLITTLDCNLDPEMIQRKKDIMDCLLEYHLKEQVLQNADKELKQRKAECAELTAQWDKTLGSLQNSIEQNDSQEEKNRGPLLPTLTAIVEKMEIMRWLIGQLICGRSGQYDWQQDPDKRISLLVLTRQHNNVDMFTRDL